MNATELYLKDGRSAEVYYCGNCRNVARTKEQAEQCCQNHRCEMCGKDSGRRYFTICEPCSEVKELKKERERFEKAEKLTAWGGWVYDGTDYYESVGEMLAQMEFDGVDRPAYVWVCEENHFVHADVEDVTDRIADNAYEDWDAGTLNGLPELKAALDAFNEANKDAISYSPDFKRVVLIEQSVEEGTPPAGN